MNVKIVTELIMPLFLYRIGKNRITSIGGRYLASAIQKSTSIFDVG